MSRKATWSTRRLVTLALAAVTVAACTTAATGRGDGHVSRATTAPPRPSTSSSPTSERSFSPDSIAIRSKANRGSELVLEVTAPPQTTFRIGQDLTYSIDCRVIGRDDGDPVTYRVVCPRQSPDGRLIATISYGDFGYTFSKAL